MTKQEAYGLIVAENNERVMQINKQLAELGAVTDGSSAEGYVKSLLKERDLRDAMTVLLNPSLINEKSNEPVTKTADQQGIIDAGTETVQESKSAAFEKFED